MRDREVGRGFLADKRPFSGAVAVRWRRWGCGFACNDGCYVVS